MCVLNYNGFMCGHSGGEIISPILCRQQNRLPHEPMCNPLKYNIKFLKEERFCRVCHNCMAQANREWSAHKTECRKQRYLPEPVIQQLNADRTRALAEVFTDGITKGPSHKEHLRIIPTSESTITEAKRLRKRLVSSRASWDINTDSLRKNGNIKPDEWEAFEQRRKDLQETYANEIDMLGESTDELLSEVSAISREREVRDPNWNTFEDVDPLEESIVYNF
ncbi:hypothetical protein F4801DRAFT_408450 [Xylaria longipes]|nr:hypothetical protein F4801DRAFT_408450 [Xylaria longipes]